MTKRIEELTSEQSARMASFAEEYIERCLSTEPCDRARVEDGMRRCYEFAELPWHGRVIWVDSPREVAHQGPATAVLDAGGSEEEARQAAREHWREYLGGRMWGAWRAQRAFFIEVCGLELEPDVMARWEAHLDANSAGWWWPHSDYVVVCDAPRVLKMERDESGARRLHCSDGPAIAWQNWELYFWRGVEVPRRWVMEPDTVTAAEVLGTENAEQRRAGAEIVGWDKLLASVPHRVVDEDEPEIGVLIHADLPDAPGSAFLRVKCGTGRTFALPVPPTIRTARAANAWTYGIPASELRVEVRT
jgi:hypothetical protein